MNEHNGRYCFTHDGEKIFLFTLQNANGTTVKITNYGAIITSFGIPQKDGSLNDIVLGFDDARDYLSKEYLSQYPWFGAAVGRCANRVKDACFTIDDKTYQLSRNRGNDQLHGGEIGFDRRAWRFMGQGTEPCPWLELSHHSPDGDQGYPGNLDVTIRFDLEDHNSLGYSYHAVSDQPTPVNLTHHSYFNLNNGSGTIHDHEIKIYGRHTLEQDDNLVATGNIQPVKKTVFDFSDFKSIGRGLEKIAEYDKTYLIDRQGNGPVAEARSARSGMLLQIFSNEPAVHFYSGKWIPQVKGKYGNQYGPFSGFCLETHQPPNAVNIPHFPDIILRPGENYFQKTSYRVLQV